MATRLLRHRQILQSAAFVNVDVALADGRRSSIPRPLGRDDLTGEMGRVDEGFESYPLVN